MMRFKACLWREGSLSELGRTQSSRNLALPHFFKWNFQKRTHKAFETLLPIKPTLCASE